MEISVIGCMPHVAGKKLPPSECYENTSFIPVPENDALINLRKLALKDKNNAVAVKNGSDMSIKLNSVHSEVLVQCHSAECDDERLIIVENKEMTLDMRVDSDDALNPIPIVAESVSHVNGISQETDVENSSSAADISCTSPDTSASVSNTNDPSSNDSYANDSYVSQDEPSTTDSPQKKKRYLFLFRPSINKILVKNKTNNSYRCYVCGGIYRQKFSLKRHYLRSHVDFRYISEADVANCKIPVPNYYEEQHSNSDNKKSANGRKKFKKSSNDVFLENNDRCLMPGLYRCHDCSDIFCNTEAELREHYNKHPDSVKKKFQCHICDASFFKKQILSRHLAGHGEKIIKTVCKRCNIDFVSKADHQKHLASHSSGRKCKYCSKVLSTSANRKRHEAVHEGLKTFHCAHCDSSFAQRKDLDRHLRKQHIELCHICSLCNKVFPSQDNLSVHIREKHSGSPKNMENSSRSEDADKPVVSKPNVIPAAKTKGCHVCKRVFHTVYAMLKHKRNAHPFYSRRKRHKKSIKKEKNIKVSSNFNEYQRPHIKSPKTANGKQTKQNGPGRPPQKSLTKREKELADERARLEEIKFYNCVHLNIAENLTNYIDGRPSQLSLKQYNFNDSQYSPNHFEERGRIPWSHFNFPQWYDVDAALKTKGREIKRPENMSVEDELLYDATGLTPAQSSATMIDQTENVINERSEVVISDDCQQNENSTLKENRELMGKCVMSIIVCYVCREQLNSYATFVEHCTNNHPNVECSFVEIVGDLDSPPVVPPELCRVALNSEGFRFSCDVPPQLSQYSMRCTKCLKQFEKGSELHEHVTICGDFLNSSSTYVPPKPNPERRIKRTMKKRMTLQQQQAALTANGFKTPEKRESVPNNAKLCDKTVRTEKLQFYKNGRLQTKSLTVDMNYFNTKPQKTVKSVSKRGRKSYAIVSSMYRNATLQPNNVKSVSKRGRKSYALGSSVFRNSTMQASTSRECPDCGTVFVSLQALNDHIKKHCSGRSLEEKERKMKLSKLESNIEAESNPCVKNTSCFNALAKQNVSECTSSSSPNFKNPKSHATASPNRSFQVGHSSNTEIKNLQLSDFHNESSHGDVELTCAPMDLSRNSSDNRSSAKSALEIAMEAVLEFVHTEEFEETNRSAHISNKLEQGSKKPTTTARFISPVPKPAIVKKVGRPRKLKKLATSAPSLLQKNLTPEPVRKNTISKLARLEEEIKKLTVRSKEKQRQKNSTHADVFESEKNTMVLKNSEPSDVPNVAFVQSDPVSDKEDPEILTADNIAAKENTSKQNASHSADDSQSCATPDFGNSSSSETIDKLSVKVNDSNDIAPNAQTTPINEVVDKVFQCDNVIQENRLGNEKDVQELPGVSEFTVVEQSDKANHGTSSHGRNSPTLEGILKVINQKLHSEEQESSLQDDSAISWLEDEKFEITPSRTKLNIIMPSSNIELLPTEIKNSTTEDSQKIGSSKDSQSVELNILPISVPDLFEKAPEQILESPSKENVVLNKIMSNSNTEEMRSVLEKEFHPLPQEVPGTPPSESTFVAGIIDSTDALGTEHADKPTVNKKVSSPVLLHDISPVSPKKNNAINPPVGRRGPGRPRRKIVDDVGAVTDVDTNETTNVSPSKTNTSVPVTQNTESNATKQNDTPLNFSSATNETSSDAVLPEASKECSDTEHNDLQTSGPPITAEPDKSSIQVENDLLSSVSLRNFRTKSKQTQNDIINSKLTLAINCSKTTEFGKNLASRMKEKMRSFDSYKTLVRIEEPNISTSAETSDTNSQASNEDNKVMRVVKKECETSELTKIHSCPYCMLEFAYLTNFRRHIKKCQTRFESKETEPVPGTPSTHLQHLPKKDEVDYSILNLYRHQSRQTQMMKEVENTNQPIQKYECGVCHRIYLNLFGLMQHKTHHKLIAASSSEQNNDSALCSEVTDIENILSFDNDLTSDAMQEENEANFDENVHFNSIAESEISETSEKSVCDTSQSVTSGVKNTDNKLPDSAVTSAVQCPNTDDRNGESGIHEEKGIEQSSSVNDNSVNDIVCGQEQPVSGQEQPVKRKRGRPFGWRKNPITPQENKESKTTNKAVRVVKSNAVLFKKKVGKLQSMDGKSLVCTKLKASTREIILNKLAKPLRQKLNLMAMEKKECLDSVPLNAQYGKPVVTPLQNALPSPKEVLKSFAKRLPVNVPSDAEKVLPVLIDAKDATEIIRNPPKSLDKSEIKSHSSVEMESNNSGKRNRGKPSLLPSSMLNKPKSEFPQKRRPGRPPKSLLSAPSTSHSTKIGYSQSSSIRNLRKMLPVLKNSDSSDSECEKTKPKIISKKKVFKICALCKDRFVSNLELHRHIQLVHSRRMQPAVSDSTRILKKLAPKSPSINTSENESNISMKRGDSPLKKPSNLKVCPICKKEFLTYLLLQNHQQIIHQKKLEPVINSEQLPTHSKKSDLVVKPEQCATYSRKSEPAAAKSAHLVSYASVNTSEYDSDISMKRSVSPQKKSPNLKVCVICKKRFLTSELLSNHIHAIHSRKSDPVAVKSDVFGRRTDPLTVKSVQLAVSSVKSKEENTSDRRTLSRQCRKPLPPLKRRRIKKEPLEQLAKKPKL